MDTVDPKSNKIDIASEIRQDTMASHIILSGIDHAVDKSILNRIAVANHDDEGVTITLTINGNELDFLEFAKHLELYIEDQIKLRVNQLTPSPEKQCG